MILRFRRRAIFAVSSLLLLAVFAVFTLRSSLSREKLLQWTGDKKNKPYPTYKKVSAAQAAPPVVDNFPLALAAHSAAELPPIPRWNKPRSPHVPECTPLFIGFTRNWRVLQQVVVAYITAGWPPEDIYVVENTGVMDANKLGQLSLQNPFFLNHTRLEMLGVNVLITPTLLTFAQLQNFYLWTSTVEKYPYYFWSHMDVAPLSDDGRFADNHPELDISDPSTNIDDYKSIYDDVLEALYEVLAAKDLKWAMRFFSYDRLALVNVTSFRDVGGWDTQIPFYGTDCDMHARLEMGGYNVEDRPAGRIWDVGEGLDDLIVLYRKTTYPNGNKVPAPSFTDPNVLHEELEAIAESEKQLEAAGWGRESEHEHDLIKRTIERNEGQKDSATTNTEKSAATTVWEEDQPNSDRYYDLVRVLDDMTRSKWENKHGRNTWQGIQKGGKGDPFYRDSEGFEIAIQLTMWHGRMMYAEKWGHRDCDIVAMGLKPDDAWRVEKDWDD